MIETVRVGQYTYRVKEVERLTSDDHVRLRGDHNQNALEIRIDKDMDAQIERVTLLHELVHAIADERNLDLTEACVNQMSVGLAALLIDNPELTSLFLEKNPWSCI